MTDLDSLTLHPERTLLLVVDLQERLAAAMDLQRMERVTRNVVMLLEGARVLGLPVVVTEQYRKGIGPTVADVAAALPPGTPVHEKLTFSVLGEAGARAAVEATGRDQVILVGMETHVCVFQTARDLRQSGRHVLVPEDAVISRTLDNTRIGLRLMEGAGAVATSTEAVLFDLLRVAGTPAFKAISPLFR
jgi:nicotinamidase-related amidase